jgi:predicted ATPase/DNA-binding winged helix-turn-helix (wHTH) protein
VGVFPGEDEIREAAAGNQGLILYFAPFRVDLQNERLWRDEQLIALRPKTFAVLRYLIERPGQLIRKEGLLRNLWPGVSVSEAVLKTSLREIRQALGDSARTPRFIETAHGRGYRFIARVQSEPSPRNGTVESGTAEQSAPGSSPAPYDTALAPPDDFVGREPELERLFEAWHTACSGRRQVIFISGEPGIGKTSLVRAFLQRLGSELALGWGQCIDQYGAGDAYLPLIEALRRLGRGPLQRSLVRALEQEAPAWLPHLPGLFQKANAAPGLISAPEHMLSEMAEALETFSRAQPLLLWLEDLHWADPSTLACVSYLARRSDRACLLLVGTFRPLALHAGHPLGAVQPELLLQQRCSEIALGFLSRQELELYFGARFGTHRFPPALLDLIYAQTAGNPLFLERVIDAWLTQGAIAQTSGTWNLMVAPEHVARDAPASIAAMIVREFDLLAGFERDLIEAASAAGMEFSAASLAGALDEDLVRVEEQCLRWARRRQFFRASGQSEWPDGTRASCCQFIHALYQQVAYERIGSARRAQLHARMGARQEAGHAARAREIAAELALHFERGQDAHKAIFYLGVAGEQALRRSACQEAIRHFERALELLRTLPEAPERRAKELELLVALGSALAMTRGHAAGEVEQVYTRARELCRQQRPTTQLFQALMGIGAFYLVRGEYQTARALSEQFLELARQQPEPDVLLEATLLSGISRIFLGELQPAARELEDTLSRYDFERHESYIILFMQDPGVAAHALITYPLCILGYLEQAREHAEQALALARRLKHPAALVLAYVALTDSQWFWGDPAGARAFAETGLALSREHGFDLYQGTLGILLGAALCELGDGAAGLAILEQSWFGLQRVGSDLAGARSRTMLASALAHAGRTAEAFAILAEAFSRLQSHEERWWEPELYRTLGELLAQHGSGGILPFRELWAASAGEPEVCYVRALELAREKHARLLELRAALSLAKVWHARGETAAARTLLSQTYDSFSEGFGTGDLQRARELLAELEGAYGECDR